MFSATYKTTLKNLLRAALLWIMVILVFSVVAERVTSVNYMRAIVENGRIVKNVTDLEEEFHIDYHGYVQALRNNFATMSIYAYPLFAIISVMLVLNRDFKDNFFEIERAGGVKAGTYFFGRLAAILTVNIVVGVTMNLLHNHFYCITRDVMGNLGMTPSDYVSETTVRVLRLFFFGHLPGVIFYIGLTYMAGCLLKSAFLGTVVGSSWVLFLYVGMRNVGFRSSAVYEYLSPHASGFYLYWGYYDTELFTSEYISLWSTEQLIIHTSIVAGVGIIAFAVSYICTRQRKI